MRLRGAKVFVRCDESGSPLKESDGRVPVLYQPRGKLYRALGKNLEPDDDPFTLSDEEAAPQETPVAPARKRHAVPFSEDTVHVFTDGACFGNPGPMGIGVVILGGQPERQEISEYLGVGTNNIAELSAILRGLERAPRDRPLAVYSDSAYAIGVLSQGWKARANRELVERIRKLCATFGRLHFVKVLAHSGVAENERCDELARQAIQSAQAAQ